MKHRSRNAGLLTCVLIALVATMVAATATMAAAAPQEPTMTIEELDNALLASPDGELHGYLATVMKGSKIETIPVDVLAVTAGYADGPGSMSSLILFQATGAKIDEIGGIAAGMSGSPIYVTDDDGLNPKLIGALSYGDWFTKNGTGLATPIEAMAEVEDLASSTTIPQAAVTQKLDEPVKIDGQTVDRVIVSDDPQSLKAESKDGAVVASPLAGVFIGGLRPGTHIYNDFTKALESRGLTVTKVATGLSSKVSTYSADFEPGSAVAMLASRGDLWVGGVGTVTYVNDDNVLAFGHPAFWSGDSGLYMCNAWVDGIWPSSIDPYKLARPAAVRGTMTQDRLAAVMGVDGLVPDEVPVTARTLNLDTGRVGTATSYLPDAVINSSNWDFEGLAPVATYLASTRVFDVYASAGSAATTTTVTVRDGSDVYTVSRANVFDSDWDIAYDAIADVSEIVFELQQLGANGIAHPQITSVDLDTQITTDRNLAEIVDFKIDGGLKRGANKVEISLLRHGVVDTQTVETTLTIPANVPLSGSVDVSAANEFGFDEESMFFIFEEDFVSGSSSIDRRTTADAVEALSSTLPNSAFTVTFRPFQLMSTGSSSPSSFSSIEATANTSWYMNGTVEKMAPQIVLERFTGSTISYNGTAMYLATVTGVEEPVTYRVYRRYVGEASRSLVTSKTLDPEMGEAFIRVPSLKKNAEITFVVDETDETLQASASTNVKVRAAVRLRTSSTSVKRGQSVVLSANVSPSTAAGKVVFERWSASSFRWIPITTKTLVGGKCSAKYNVNSATRFRARYTGGTTNASGTSGTVTVRTR